MKPTHMVFDIGGVLVHWDPVAAFAEACGGREEAMDFIARVGFRDKNARADAGETFADLAQEIEDARDREIFARYVDNYPLTVERKIKGSWTLLDQMKAQSTRVHAITNWSAETWPRGLIAQPRLGKVFETLIVSGEERMAKPDAAIFELFCERAGVAPEACFFVDDSVKNVEAARAMGMQAAQFISPKVLRLDLIDRGFL
ncbi:MAG: HAD family phosphatase [Pseudomonadota bacterium]|nr:HAD family phosphatase [Pseudomonadota bacterium]